MRFCDIPGHNDVKARLRHMAETDRIPHAILLEGPEGTGKLSLARAFTQYLHCTARTPDGEPCGRCPSCRQHQAFNHVDTFFVYPVVKTDKMTGAPISEQFIDQWREFIKDNIYPDFRVWADMFGKKNARPVTYVTESAEVLRKLALTAVTSRYKVVLWWLPELMVPEAANKLLKIIEEPFSDTVFVMVSNSPRDILLTIYSRLQRLSCRRLPDDVVAHELVQRHGITMEKAASVAHLSLGSMLKAEQVLNESEFNDAALERFKQLMRLAYQRKVADLRRWAHDLADEGREYEIRFYEYAIRMMRENFMFRFNIPDLTYLSSGEEAFSTNFARFITEQNVEKLISTFEKARTDIAGNGNGKMINFDTAIKVIMLLIP
ncbi:MAG: DNA polymerase III subunit delta [Muribaculaceae bacterium]|nr:DNA polymerase III subunit delta [Muribaculaceae bacterium]